MESLEEVEAALDEDPLDIETFKEGAVLLTADEDWEAVEAYYIRQLRRINDLDDDEIKFHLWYQLGQIYEFRLKRLEHAEQAYQVALATRPDNHEVETRLVHVQGLLEE